MEHPDKSLLNKGLGLLRTPGQVAGHMCEWNLLSEDLCLPSAVLYQERLLHNLDWMRRFIAAYGLKLAPHGKTTMAPKLFRLQLDSGAWGITLATAHQTMVAYEHGVRRVLMANQLVGKGNMEMISRLLEDPSFDFYCLVDSPAIVEQLQNFFAGRQQKLSVLLELGLQGGRTGVRDPQQLTATLASLTRSPALTLAGLELYEGVAEDEAAVRDFLHWTVDAARQLLREGRFDRVPFLLSGAGSAWYDVVAEVFADAGFGDTAEIVLRPGCYLTHDIGVYRKAQAAIQARNTVAREMRSGLQPALQVWAYVQSVPEKERAIIAMGKRDAAFDAGLPVPSVHFRPGETAPRSAPARWSVIKMMDQHSYLHLSASDDLRVGDMIGFDISHPCLTFDKWRALPVLDSSYQVVDVIETFF